MMRAGILQIAGFCLVLLFSGIVQCQVTKQFDDSSVIKVWENATIKSIDYQLSLKQAHSFFNEVLLVGKQFITAQSKDSGLRESFYYNIFKRSYSFSQFNQAYIVEHYRSREGFSASISLYMFGVNSMQYLYEMQSGRWQLVGSNEIKEDTIRSLFDSVDNYLCDSYYAEESIIITRFSKTKAESKAFFFLCSTDFKKIRKIVFDPGL